MPFHWIAGFGISLGQLSPCDLSPTLLANGQCQNPHLGYLSEATLPLTALQHWLWCIAAGKIGWHNKHKDEDKLNYYLTRALKETVRAVITSKIPAGPDRHAGRSKGSKLKSVWLILLQLHGCSLNVLKRRPDPHLSSHQNDSHFSALLIFMTSCNTGTSLMCFSGVPVDTCWKNVFIRMLLLQTLAFHFIEIVGPLTWALHKCKQQRRFNLIINTLQIQIFYLFCVCEALVFLILSMPVMFTSYPTDPCDECYRADLISIISPC